MEPTEMVEKSLKIEEFAQAQARRRYSYDYPMPSITATRVVFCCGHVAVITRRDDPFKGRAALPGGFMNLNETNRAACVREVKEEIGISISEGDLTLVCVNDDVDRDPRGRVVDFAYSVVIPLAKAAEFRAGDDAADAQWVSLAEIQIMKFAFDHGRVIQQAIEQRKNQK